ncbi:MAG: SDR family NAD(P)-dependent oxidoreductase [Gammaproteobacteria bacterium]|nr:SDR family NAD(P)-dependent oxidoreductase [Gammaproteobacteria bacterium]
MNDRSVLITGCSSGIGRCLAHGLKDRGYRVFATARQSADVDALAADGFDSVVLDLASTESIERAVATVLERSRGRLHALINNGAYGQPGAVEDLSRAALRAQFETNVFGTHELTVRLLPTFRTQNHGRIIQISSLLGLVCMPYRGAYNASKFALEALSDTLRLELRGTGIHVCLVEPGPIATRFRENSHTAFKAHIDPAASTHTAPYKALERRLMSRQPVPFTLPPTAVLSKVLKALEAPRPRIRYYVTLPTHWFALLRRLLPYRVLDKVVAGIGAGGRR